MNLRFEQVRCAIRATVRREGASWAAAYLDALSRQAFRALERGALPDAEACCLYVLGRNPAQGRALECVGAIAARRGEWEKANTSLREALRLTPEDPNVLARLGDLYFARGDMASAAKFAARALERDPNQALALRTLGNVHVRRGDLAGAVRFLERAVEQAARDPAVWSELGSVRTRLSQLNEARACFQRALELDPDSADLHVALGEVYLAARHSDDARSCFEAALRIAPDNARALSRLGTASAQAGNSVEAERLLQRARDVAPGDLEPLVNLGLLHQEAGRVDQALECYRRAKAIDPICVEAHVYAGRSHLFRGDYAAGWDELEWRLRLPALQHLRDIDRPMWRGEDLSGRSVLLQREPGVSDHVQFLRYVPMLVSSGARVVVETFPELQRLVARMPGIQRVVTGGEESVHVAPDVDWRCPILSLAHRFGTTAASVPASVPYLVPDPAGVATWRARLQGRSPMLKVGLCWAEAWDAPGEVHDVLFRELNALRGSANLEYVNIQPRSPGTEYQSPRQGPQQIDWSAEMRDLADAADLISALDLVIGPPTVATHLAGAIGAPTWILLPLGRSDWRWVGDVSVNAWYPSARLFRQQTAGQWDDVVRSLGAALADLQRSRHP